MHNRCVKNLLKFSIVCEKKLKKCQVLSGGIFWTHTVQEENERIKFGIENNRTRIVLGSVW